MDYSAKEDIIEGLFDKAKTLILPSENNNFRSRFLQSNLLLYCVVLVMLLKIFSITLVLNLPQNIFFADITKSVLENFINQARQTTGLAPLSANEKLDQVAQLKAENMIQNQYFSHTSPSGITPWYWFSKVGYKYKYAGENLAIGFFDSREVYEAWLNSPSHKANILNPNYKEVGTAVMTGFGPNNTIVVVQEFGSQLQEVVVPQPKNQPVAKNNTPEPTFEVRASPTVVSEPEQTPTNSSNNSPQVAGAQGAIEAPKGIFSNDLSSRIISSVLYNSDSILQKITYGLIFVVIGALLMLIFVNLNGEIKKELIYRSAVVILLLIASTIINKDAIISLIPHQIII